MPALPESISARAGSSLYRRQFLLGPREAYGLEGWPRQRVAPRHPAGAPLHLATHPDLGVHAAEAGDASLTLLGYVLDPDRPDAGDAGIVADWLTRWRAGEELSALVHGSAGRFVLIARRPGENLVLHDAAGLRTVVHGADANGDLWCASDTPILAVQIGLHEDPARRRLWIDSSHRAVIRFPLRETLHAELRALLPNHVLDLDTGEQHRFWPTQAIERGDPDEVAEASADHLRTIVEAGARRFPLALALTAGIDSRMLLAALHERRDELYCFTFCRKLDAEIDDVRIPAGILRRAGLRHHVFHCDAPDDPVLRAAFEASHAAPSRTRWQEVLELRRHVPWEYVRVSGHVSETARATFLPRIDASPYRLARTSYPNQARAAERCTRSWWREAHEVSRRTGYAVRDLHFWESRMGRWAAASQNQYDFASETFTPFACRALLERLLSVDERHRAKRKGSPLSVEMVRKLWPELAEQPVNPTKASEKRLRRRLRRAQRGRHALPRDWWTRRRS